MKVKITGSRSIAHWYKDHIGEVFEILHTDNENLGSDAIHRIKGGRGIYVSDCTYYSETDEFPTIKEDYF